jgi:molecular chaperone DnaJ
VNLWDREARALYEEVTQAYRVLSDPSSRSLYDRHGAATAGARADGPARPEAGRRGDDLHVPVDLGFPQSVSGVALDLTVERLSPCEACQASGARPGGRATACRHCGGTGLVWTDEGAPRAEPCPACAGTGERVEDPCPACRGRGVRPAPATVAVVLPPGMDTGAQFRVPGEGHAGPFAGPRGDLIVITRVEDDRVFTRKGDNLHCEVPLSIAEAVLGARVALDTPHGPALLAVPPGTQSGQVFRLRGRGMPRLAAEGRGDLYLTVRVETPGGLDARTQELFREVARFLPPAPVRSPRRVQAP